MTKKNEKCSYCLENKIIELEINDMNACKKCTDLLRDPEDGPRLIRGFISIQHKGSKNQKNVENIINKFMELIYGMRS